MDDKSLEKKKLFHLLEIFFLTSNDSSEVIKLRNAYDAAISNNSHESYYNLLSTLYFSSLIIPGFRVVNKLSNFDFRLVVEFDISNNENECSEFDILHGVVLQNETNILKNDLKTTTRMNNIEDVVESFRLILFGFMSDRNGKNIEKHSDENVLHLSNSEDSYTFIMVDPWSLAGLVAIFIFFVQITTFYLAILDIPDSESTVTGENIYNIPKGVSLSVHVTQGIAIFLISLVQRATWESTSNLCYGFNEHLRNQGIEYECWLVSNLLRLIEGLMAIIVMFSFILSSDDVVNLIKDFTAITFVSEFDNIIYELANMNVIGKYLKNSVDKCESIDYVVNRNPRSIELPETCEHSLRGSISATIKVGIKTVGDWDRLRRFFLHPFVFVAFLFIAMYGVWISLVLLPQLRGDYLCQKVFVQFDDQVNYELSYFSGSYKLLTGTDRRKRGENTIYRESKRFWTSNSKLKTDQTPVIIRFCEDLQSWVLTYESNDQRDECNEASALVKSSIVKNDLMYDLLAVSPTDWKVKQNDKWIPLIEFRTSCEDTSPKYSLDESNLCVSLHIDDREAPFQSTRSWSKNFTMMSHSLTSNIVLLYDHPVFVNEKYVKEEMRKERELIIYLGKRWAITSTDYLTDYLMENKSSGMTLEHYLENSFHAKWSNYSVAFLSEPVTVDTQKDKMNPKELSWLVASTKIAGEAQVADPNRASKSTFLCATCNNSTNQCFHEGKCLQNNTCSCAKGSDGKLCQVIPIGNGFCDEYFNKREYDFDGGDCCPHTCVSGTYRCGRDKTGLIYVGYDLCNTIEEGPDSWRKSSAPLSNLLVSYVSLSSSGRNLALIESTGRTVRVYDNDGARWTMRGSAVTSVEHPSSCSVEIIGHDDILDQLGIFSPVTVAVKSSTSISTHDWYGSFWIETGIFYYDGNLTAVPLVINLENNGNSLGILYSNQTIQFYQRNHYTVPWVKLPNNFDIMESIGISSISKDGTIGILGNQTCIGILNFTNGEHNLICDVFNDTSVKHVAISPGGNMLGVLTHARSQGDVLMYNLNDGTLIMTIHRVLRRQSIGKDEKIKISNDGESVIVHSSAENLLVFYRRNEKVTSLASQSMALSSNQDVLAVISPTLNTVDILHRDIHCEGGFSNIHFTLITDSYPSELLWELVNITMEDSQIAVLKKGGPYDTANAMVKTSLCISHDQINFKGTSDVSSCIAVRIYDFGLDGLRSPGSIGISSNGIVGWRTRATDGYETITPVLGNKNCMNNMEEYRPWPKKYNALMHTECLVSGCVWKGVGSVFYGGLNSGDFQKALSFSADGLFLAVGEYNNNRVKVYRYSDQNNWVQYGTSITGEDSEIDYRFGSSVSLSADGSIISIGAAGSHLDILYNVKGKVYSFVYNKKEKDWSQRGNVIDLNIEGLRIGYSVSLSADGEIVAFSCNWEEEKVTKFYIHVFEYDIVTEEWMKRGNLPDETEEAGGFVKTSLSSTGSVVAVGFPRHNFDSSQGKVKVYEYTRYSNTWKQRGEDFIGYAGNFLGSTLDISSDGTVLAVGGRAKFPVRVYKFNLEIGEWEQQGQNINVDKGREVDLSLSSKGSILVVSYNNIVDVFIYDKTADMWKISFSKIDPLPYSDGLHPFVVASADAIMVAARTDDSVNIYRLSKEADDSECNMENQFAFNFTIRSDSFPGDIQWNLQDHMGVTIFGGTLPQVDINDQNTHEHIYTKCLDNRNSHFAFIIQDHYGDGLCCKWGEGYFSLQWDNELVDDENIANFTKYYTVCLPQSADLFQWFVELDNFKQPMGWALYDANNNILIMGRGISLESKKEMYFQCVPKNTCLKFGIVNPNEELISVSLSNNDEDLIFEKQISEKLSVEKTKNCDLNSCLPHEVFFELDFVTNDCPKNLSWKVKRQEDTIVYGSNYTEAFMYHHYETCIPKVNDQCTTFVANYEKTYDPCSGSVEPMTLRVSWDGQSITKDEEFGPEGFEVTLVDENCN